MVIDALTKFYKGNGFIVGLDGRKLMVRAEYKLLNTAIQSTAALIFKMWGINVNRMFADRPDIYCRQIIEYHDEYGYRCHGDHIDDSKAIIMRGANMIQGQLNLITPIDADCKVGMSWSETH